MKSLFWILLYLFCGAVFCLATELAAEKIGKHLDCRQAIVAALFWPVFVLVLMFDKLL